MPPPGVSAPGGLVGDVGPAELFLNNLLKILRLGGLGTIFCVGVTELLVAALSDRPPNSGAGALTDTNSGFVDVLRFEWELECNDAEDEAADGVAGLLPPPGCKKEPPGLADRILPRELTFAITAPISSTLSRILSLRASFSLSFSPQTSTGSRKARSISSMPRLWNLAIFASVPASTMTLVMTLCACRLYSGMILRRVLEEAVLEATEVKEAVDAEYRLDVEASDRPELVRASDAPSELLRLDVTDVAEVGVVDIPSLEVTPDGGFALGGTSWTWRLSGWLDLDGGGRTKINVWKINQRHVEE
jgi:hypothetical protein